MTIFTWGDGDYQVPQGDPLPLDRFLENYLRLRGGQAVARRTASNRSLIGIRLKPLLECVRARKPCVPILLLGIGGSSIRATCG